MQYRPGTGRSRAPILLLNKSMNNDSNAGSSPKLILNTRELAEFLNISKQTVYRLIEKRQIPFSKVGGSLRFNRESILEFMESNRVEPIGIKNYEPKKKEQ